MGTGQKVGRQKAESRKIFHLSFSFFICHYLSFVIFQCSPMHLTAVPNDK
jgi:hypothetical protein